MRVLTPSQKGSIAEAEIVAAAVKLGVEVYKPVNEGLPCDLIFGVGGSLLRVQCKWAARRGDVVVITCRTCRRTKDGFLRRTYTTDEIDAIAAYFAEAEICYFVPLRDFPGRPLISLRLEPTRNNQRVRVNWAKDYEFAATLGSRGAIAQLGERLHGMQEVAGSSPAGSTS